MSLRRTVGIVSACGLTLAVVAAAPAYQPDRKGPPPASGKRAEPAPQPGRAPAQNNNAGGEVAPDRVTVLSIEKTDIDRFLVDKKDANLKAALKMIPARVADLASELGLKDRGAPPELFAILPDMLGRPARLAVQFRPDPEGNSTGFGLVAAVDTTDKAAAERLASNINASLKQTPLGEMMEPSATDKSMMEVPTPVGVVRWGPAKIEGDKWGFTLSVGKMAKPEAAFADGAPASALAGKRINPFFLRGRLDLAPLTPLVQMFRGMGDGEPVFGAVLGGLEDAGLVGANSVRYEFDAFHTDDRAVMVTTAVGAKRFPKAGYVTEPLTAAQLRVIPADAHAGAIARYNLPMLVGELRPMIDQVEPVAEALDEIKQTIGIDLWTDVVEQFTGTFAYYFSDSTGGGGLGSLVVALELKDGAKGAQVSQKLADAVNKWLADEAQRESRRDADRGRGGLRPEPTYVRARTYTQAGVHFGTVSFPGLPIPVEPTYAVTDKWLLITLTPQAALAAAAQATGKGDAGITAHPDVASTLPKGLALNSLMLVDARKCLPKGYTFLSLMGSGLANAVRTNPALTKDGGREPAMIVPPFAELMAGARSQVTFSHWVGDDLVSEWQGDRSLLVNVGSTVGAISPVLPVIAAAIAGAAISSGSMRPMGAPMGRPRPNFSIVEPAEPAPLAPTPPPATATAPTHERP